MAEQRPPVPAVPSVVLALGHSLEPRLQWLERRFRTEIGALYPANLLRFRLLARSEQLSPDVLHTLCDPLLAHPLWLGLRERGLAAGGEQGPQLSVYAIVSQDDARGCRLLAPLHTHLRTLYAGQLVPALSVFYVGTDPQSLWPYVAGEPPVPCFVLGPVKQFGYRTAGFEEPFETIRLALNALLASSAAREVGKLLTPGRAAGLSFFALGASAIAVARPHMETWLRNTLLRRLVGVCLGDGEPGEGQPAPHREARHATADLFGLDKAEGWRDEPDELWARGLGRRITCLFAQWATEFLQPWGIEVHETRRGHWRVVARTEGDLYRRLQQVLSPLSGLQGDAQAALARDVVRLAQGLGRHLAYRQQAILGRWVQIPDRAIASGPGCLGRMQAIVAATEAGLNCAAEALQRQRAQPLWLRSDHDLVALAGILSAQMVPVRSAAERARLSFVPPHQVALRLLPFLLLLGGVGADLWPGWQGLAGGLAAGLSFAILAAAVQFRHLRREMYRGVRELCRLYEGAISDLLLGEARNLVRQLQESVAVSAAQLQAVRSELEALDQEASQVLDELARFPQENTYLERQISDPAHCRTLAGQLTIEGLLAAPLAREAESETLARMLAAAMRGDLPAAALGPGLIETAGRFVTQQGHAAIETRVEEMLVAGHERPFSAPETMDSLHQRALPLWPAQEADGPEVALVVMSREAAMAFQGWLSARKNGLRLLPTLQRDRISYLRLRRLALPEPSQTEAQASA
jgi:hypothetical protein